MDEKEFMQIWKDVFDANKEEIESIASLTKEQANLVISTLTLYIKGNKQ